MDVKTDDHSKIKGNKPFSGLGASLMWIRLDDNLSTFQGGMVTNLFLVQATTEITDCNCMQIYLENIVRRL